ncbi:MAG: hypothetical protein AAFV46_16105 [Cyanobacteria bacterium J06635_11]
MAHRRQQFGIAFLIGIFFSAVLSNFTALGLNQAGATTNGFAGHPIEPCIQALVSHDVFDQRFVNGRYPSSGLTQLCSALAL